MTNREWLLNKMQSMSDEELAEIIRKPCVTIDEHIDCEDIKKEINTSIITCNMCIKYWLQSKYKEPIKLSEAERVILENINKEYKWIARDKAENMLFIYQRKPYKNDYGNWLNGGTNHGLELFNHIFPFITWQDDEPYNIEELLKNVRNP